MSNLDFWESWKNKNSIEEKAINSVIKARDKVVKALSKSILVAIYIKGSFARREMREGSDVDMVPIVTKNEYEKTVFAVNSPEIEPVVVVPLSLWELKHNRLCSKGSYHPDLRAEPDLFLKKLHDYKLIFGIPLSLSDFPTRKDIQVIRDEIIKIKEGYIPAYKKGKTSFSSLAKEFFWLIEFIQNHEGKKVKHSFKGIKESIKDRTHPIHLAFALLSKSERSKEEENLFITELMTSLAEAQKSYF